VRGSIVLIAHLAIACGAPPAQVAIANRGSAAPADTLPECKRTRGNLVATGGSSRDVPMLVLYERGGGALGFDVASFALWRDGTVVFKQDTLDEIPRLLQAKLDAETSRDLVARALARVRDLPSFTELVVETDEPIVELVVRDPDGWRDVAVGGLDRDSTTVPAKAQVFFSVYRELLARRPTQGDPAPPVPPSERPDSLADGYPAYRGESAIELVCSCARALRTE
jgi:hypothetical protein